ncbi:MAG: hypothetical protein IJY36_04350 [Coprobacter sp.]|nr:hypothetical protein [Coprobacter sp.]
MYHLRQYIILLLLAIVSLPTNAQFHLNYKVEANVIAGSGDNTPFYLMNNRGGTISFNPNNGYLRVAIDKSVDTSRRFSYGLDVDILTSYNDDIPAYAQQAYFNAKLYCFDIMVGSKEEGNLLWNDALSSGGWVWSGNSRPIPQVCISLPHWVSIAPKGTVQLRAAIAYGRFVDDKYQRHKHGSEMQYTQGQLYHRKYFLLRFGHPSKKFYGIFGCDMAAQFGGTVYNLGGNQPIVHFPSKLKDFFKVFIPLSGGDDAPIIDQVNVSGNHLGSYIFTFGTRQASWEGRVYYEHPFDDHTGMGFLNGCDGLWGVEFSSKATNPIVKGVVVEYLNTRNQSGPFLWDEDETIPVPVKNGDYYYGHTRYNGWVHRGHTIGNTLIASPGYNTDGYLGFKSSQVEALHLGINGYITPEIDYRLLTSIQRGWGNSYIPFTEVKKEFSLMLEARYNPRQLKGWQFTAGFAIDRGTTFGDNWGLQFGIRKSGRLL